jgi:signal transduction histidine kinase
LGAWRVDRASYARAYPQEITRALLNLISNGFYASAKRKVDDGDGFEPMLSATTKNLGGKVEIRIRDNGTGIPEEVKEKIFNPFFTTKPLGRRYRAWPVDEPRHHRKAPQCRRLPRRSQMV